MNSDSSRDNQSEAEASVCPLTLVELLREKALVQPQRVAYTFLLDGETQEAGLTYAELDRQAKVIGSSLARTIAPGEPVLLLYPPGLEYIAAFFGCLYAGAIAVPAYPPRLNRNLLRLEAIVSDAQARAALTTEAMLSKISPLFSQSSALACLRWLTHESLSEEMAKDWQPPLLDGDSSAFLQYTSGSTSTPKGVILSHRNLLHNERMMQRAFRQSEQSIIVGWLPLYHDMGLIGNVIQPLFAGARCILMSPLAFLQRPLRWLQAISRYRATTSGGPNFAYDFCVRRITAEQREQLDLSSWSIAFNGAEPVRAETLERFAATFAQQGFRREAFRPCYGLAEATLLVSVNSEAGPPVVKTVEAKALEANQVRDAAAKHAAVRVIVGCGEALPEQEIVVVDLEHLTRCAQDRVGEVWISGPSVAEGYWQRPEETRRSFQARLSTTDERTYLRTGDLGFLQDGQLFITGRLKDLIIIRGRNHHPQDIEFTVEKCHPALRSGCGAAFSVEVAGEEQLVIVQEAKRHQIPELTSVAEAISAAVADEHEVQVHAVVLLKPGSIPKTSSGKIQRHACRAAFLEHRLQSLAAWRAQVAAGSEGMTDTTTLIGHSAETITDWLHAQLAARLGVERRRIDVNEPIARYGLDSLTAIDLMHSIETRLGVALPFTTFLQNTSVAQLAAETLRRANALYSEEPTVGDASPQSGGRYPLSRGQQALWFLYQMAPTSRAYNLVSAARVLSNVDGPALRRALQALAARHPALRTTFSAIEGAPAQQIHERMAIAFHEEDASAWSEESIRDHLLAEAHRLFVLEVGPLLRVHLFRRSPEESFLLLTGHHIVVDFWSLEVLLHELGVLYAAEHNGAAARLPKLAWQFADYVRWQEQMLASAEGERHWAYWQKQFSGELPVVNLPADRPRPLVQTYRGAAEYFHLDTELARRLKLLGQDHGATLYMILLAAFQVLLHRYTGQTDIIVGSPISGRSRAATVGLVGYLVNAVALRTDLSGDPRFIDYLKQVRQVVLEAFEHQDYPFALLVERLQPVRDPSRSPLFQILLTLQTAHPSGEKGLTSLALGQAGAELNLGGLRLQSLGLDQQIAQFDLRVMLAEVDGGLTASLQYNTDLFDGATIKRLARHFKTLLEGITSDPRQRLSLLPFVTGAEQQQLLSGWNNTRAEYPRTACLHELIQAQVERTPEAPAVSFRDQNLTYKQLDARANQLAQHLRRLGVRPEVRVGILLERSVEVVVALLGVLKAGGAYVPLDPSYPRQRVEFMLADAGVRVLISVRKHVAGLERVCERMVYLDEVEEQLSNESEQRVASKVGVDNLAYVIYTSGSTGQPKGAMNTHRGIVNRLHWMQNSYRLTESDCVLQKTPFSFDVSVWEFFWPLMTGARLLVAQPDGHQDPAYLLETIREQNVTTIHFVPSMLHVFLEQPGVEECRCLRQVICSGEELKFELQERFNARLDATLHNLYGPTEAAVDVTSWACERNSRQRHVPIGRPIANTQIHLLDERQQLVPVGVPGELHIGGAGVGRGYLSRPDLTAEKFIPDPFSSAPGARLYRTGDLARRLPTGEILYLARLDHQVKLRGMRIELDEVETVLSAHPGVREAVVLSRRWANDEQRLVAYLVREEGEEASVEQWRQYLKERLPEYMIPAAFVVLDQLPLTPNGKLDRRALPVPALSRAELTSGYVEPRTPVEEILAHIWSKVLGVARVGVYDNFFELGGDSILSLQIVARANQAGLSLTLQQMFRYQTIAELSVVAGIDAGVSAEQNSVTGRVPLTPIQHWFFEAPVIEPRHFNQYVLLAVREALNATLLRQAVAALLQHHDALRLRFELTKSGWQQIGREREQRSVCAQVNLSMLQGQAQGAALQAAAAGIRHSLALTDGPLLRVVFFDLGAGRAARLLLVLHYPAVDGVSWRILLEDLEQAYAQLRRGEKVSLGLKTTSFKQWAEKLQQYSQSDELKRELEYWLERKRDASATVMVDKSEGINTAASARSVSVELSPAETQALLHDVPAVYRTQINEVLLTAVAQAYRHWSGQTSLLIDVEGHGREGVVADADLSRTVGWFTALYPLKLELGAASSPGEALKRIKEQVRRVPRGGVGYGVLKYLSAEDWAVQLRLLPPAEVSFNYLEQLDQVLDKSSLFARAKESCGPRQGRQRQRRYLIEIAGSVTDAQLRVQWTYSENLHLRSTIDRLASAFIESLRRLIRHCQSTEEDGFTPSDFQLAKLDQHKLNKLSALLDKR